MYDETYTAERLASLFFKQENIYIYEMAYPGFAREPKLSRNYGFVKLTAQIKLYAGVNFCMAISKVWFAHFTYFGWTTYTFPFGRAGTLYY